MKLFLIFIFCFPANAFAVNASGEYTTMGALPCGEWVEGRKVENNRPYEHFILGILTGINMTLKGKSNFFEGIDVESLFLYVDKFCRENPLKHAPHAIRMLLDERGDLPIPPKPWTKRGTK